MNERERKRESNPLVRVAGARIIHRVVINNPNHPNYPNDPNDHMKH